MASPTKHLEVTDKRGGVGEGQGKRGDRLDCGVKSTPRSTRSRAASRRPCVLGKKKAFVVPGSGYKYAHEATTLPNPLIPRNPDRGERERGDASLQRVAAAGGGGRDEAGGGVLRGRG